MYFEYKNGLLYVKNATNMCLLCKRLYRTTITNTQLCLVSPCIINDCVLIKTSIVFPSFSVVCAYGEKDLPRLLLRTTTRTILRFEDNLCFGFSQTKCMYSFVYLKYTLGRFRTKTRFRLRLAIDLVY